jgi:hypothetical protein
MLIRLTLMATILIAVPALAQTPASPSQSQRPATVAAVLDSCQADLRTLCGNEPFQMNQLTQCVRQNRDKLSPACRAVWPEAPQPRQAGNADVRSEARAMRQACAADLRTQCGEKKGRELNQCRRANLDKFSEACRTALADLQRARQAQRRGGSQQDDED